MDLLETIFVKVASKSEIPVGKTKKVQLNDKEVLIINVGGKYYAIGASALIRMETFHRVL